VPGVLVPGVITPVEGSIVNPAVELKPVPVNGPPERIVTVGVIDAALVQKDPPG